MLSRYIFGTTRLGDESIPFESRVALARKAADEGIWFHTSHTYGSALQVLKAALDLNRSRVPRMIYKIGWSSVEEVKGQIEEQLAAVGLSHMSIGQLCPGGDLALEIRNGGPALDGLARLKADGLVGGYVIEVFPWTSVNALDCLRGGHHKGLIDACIFYLNPLQRFASNELWDTLTETNFPIVAMRTVSGGNVEDLASSSHAPAWQKDRAGQVAPLFRQSGIAAWSEFAMRFSLSLPRVAASVGATSRPAGLEEFLAASKVFEPLDSGIVREILAMQRVWSDEVDMKAEPWSM